MADILTVPTRGAETITRQFSAKLRLLHTAPQPRRMVRSLLFAEAPGHQRLLVNQGPNFPLCQGTGNLTETLSNLCLWPAPGGVSCALCEGQDFRGLWNFNQRLVNAVILL